MHFRKKPTPVRFLKPDGCRLWMCVSGGAPSMMIVGREHKSERLKTKKFRKISGTFYLKESLVMTF